MEFDSNMWVILMLRADMTYIYTLTIQHLTHKQLETHVCILSTVATDALFLKNQAISIHNADQISIELDQFQTKILLYNE